MTILMQASTQWASRPSDERYLNLIDMQAHFQKQRDQSRATVAASRKITVVPAEDHKGLSVVGQQGVGFMPTHWSFAQLAQLAEAPAGYLRTMPAEIVADCLNYGLHFKRDVQDVGLLLQKNGENVLRAATGPNYGRIWNNDIVGELINRFGDGINGRFRVPGEFGKEVVVDKGNTTLYASDRDMFVFLADEKNRIEIPGRRQLADGTSLTGSMARGFFCWNSEVGDKTFGISTFLFDYVCMNRIVWGAQDIHTVKIRHTASAPGRWADELVPALEAYADSSTHNVVQAIEAAKAAKITIDVNEFLAKRFSKRLAVILQDVHMVEENKPIETLWDAATAVTAHAKTVRWADERVDLEKQGGELITLASK